MENIAFIATSIVCAIFAFVTWCDRKLEEKNVEAIVNYVDKKIKDLKQEILKKQEYQTQCLIFKSVHVTLKIHGLSVETCIHNNVYKIFLNDINIFDCYGEKMKFKVNVERDPEENIYTLHFGHKMYIDFEDEMMFKYIEFIGLRLPVNNGQNFRHKAIVSFLNFDKTVICTKTLTTAKYKIYNTAFLSEL